MNKYVGIQTHDGNKHDGFIAHVGQDHVILAIPTDEMMNPMQGSSRQFGFHSGFFPRRRFIQRRFPFPFIASLFLLPFFF
ncbi:phosphatidylinositol kinase [Paenibacillus sp. 481]|uniref:phosphatidylinositol kinase n=1 Tax=Paenibacillus sp. 481 TaxID=2835869 RepID=UPI001E317AD6|nr:phosphatidylinositol kinase [Paenibacillus sp. 481]